MARVFGEFMIERKRRDRGVVGSVRVGNRVTRAARFAVICLAATGSAVAARRIVKLAPVVMSGYHAPAAAANPVAQLAALDDLFAHYPVLTLVHIVRGLLFMLLGPLQFSVRIRARRVRWHRLSGRILVICGAA